jgi:CRP/FNR family transcriptional regulator
VDKIAAFRHTALFGKLSDDALAELADLAQLRLLNKGEVLFLAGEQATGLFVIASGQIRAYRVNAQGREQTIHIERSGATLAEVPLFDDGPYPATAVAEEAASILFLEKDSVIRFLMKHPEAAVTALRLMARRVRGHAELVDSLALKQVGQRVAHFLLKQGHQHGARTQAGLEVPLTLSNEDLAKHVGSVREVVSRTLSRLESEGLIVQATVSSGKRRVLIRKEAELEHYAQKGEFGP